MSEENVEIVRWAFAYEMYGRGDRAEAATYFAPDFVMNPVEEGPSYGLDSIRDNIEQWASAWEDLEVTAEEFLDAGDRVVVTARHRGRGRESGVTVLLMLGEGSGDRKAAEAPVCPKCGTPAAGNRCAGGSATTAVVVGIGAAP